MLTSLHRTLTLSTLTLRLRVIAIFTAHTHTSSSDPEWTAKAAAAALFDDNILKCPDLPGEQRLESALSVYREDTNWLYTLYAARHLIFSRSKRLDEKVRSSLSKDNYPHEPT